MHYSPIIFLDLCLATLGLFIIRRFIRSRSTVPLPPGPKGLPLVGNILDMPSEKEWLTFAKWGDTWGDLCSVTILGQPLIIINSAQVASEMLDKKSSIYSDRPILQMGGELVGWKNTLALLPYGDRFRRFRRLFHTLIGSHSIMKQFIPVEEFETRRFLRRLLTKPEDLASHIRWTAGSIILRISHGYDVKEKDDPFIELAEKATEQFSLSTIPGGFLVDVIPALRHIPKWFPGAGFRRTAIAWASTLVEMVDQPYNFVKQQMAAGIAPGSFTSNYLEGRHLTAEEEHDLKWSAASLYSGGADTTVSAIYSFFLAITLFPEVAKKAQAEIDAVVGNDRLPTFADRAQLPCATPSNARRHPRRFLDSKGSLIIANIWKITHDPKTYNDPLKFNPDRFIPADGKAAEPDPRAFTFGFGRRLVPSPNIAASWLIHYVSICPGLHMADASVFISCVMSLAVFDVSKYVENGVVVEPINDKTTGTISHPKPFKCCIQPRSEKAVALIQAEELR
ncbi:cytochrome P450 [Infundibulicybe gibba]|nr:cytochrome P450 [Infundibulicybe gibba]